MAAPSNVALAVLCNDIPLDSKEVPITEGIEQRAGSGHFFSCPSRILTGCFLNRLGHSKPMTRGPNFEPGFGPIQPQQRQKNGVLSYMDLQKDEECHLFRSYFIFDVATKRIPLKGCFYVPDVLLQQQTCIKQNWPSCNEPFFFVVRNNKKGKNFGQIAFLLGQYAQKGTVQEPFFMKAISLLTQCFYI